MGREKINSGECAAAIPGTLITVPWNKSPATSRRVTPSLAPDAGLATDIILEKRLPNGDVYIGTFSGKTPHGSGKYVWWDGCVYDGEWRKGKASGHGRLSWPSGVIFEGEFRSGRMDGFGTFTGMDGDVYRGSWSGDRKQGYGVKHFSNGDYYEGHWKRNLLDGHGTYLWRNGNEYIGEWKNGTIHGRGILVWNNGKRYAGNWYYGALKGGHKIFTWTNRSSYTGCWWSKAWKNHNNRQQILNRTFHPAQSSKNGNENDCLKVYSDHKLSTPLVGKESLNVVVNNGGNNKCSLPDDAITGRASPKLSCDIIDNLEASMLYRNGLVFSHGGIEQCSRNSFSFNGGEVKIPWQMISKGHKSCDLMRSLQLGIRYSLCKHDSIPCDLKATDFDPKEEFWTRFPSPGSKNTPPHPSPAFRSKDFCPVVFRYLRELFKVDSAGYMSAICGDDGLRELSSPGKSGSSFYLTRDDRFMIKTLKKSELKVLVKMLPSYYLHVSRYENSLITKFYGVHCVKPVGGFKTWFVVMGNLLLSECRIHRRFDLKGSSHGRTANRTKGETDETTTLKDLDLNYMFHLQANWQIHCDCEFLERQRIMDYSLLVGLHFHDDGVIDKIGKGDLNLTEKITGGCCFVEDEQQETNRILAGGKPMTRLGTTNMPARAQRVVRRRDLDRYTRPGFSYPTPSCDDEIYEVVLYLGIIDILQNYDITKKIEHAYKSLKADPSSISAVDPKHYSMRFRNFVGRIFVEGP